MPRNADQKSRLELAFILLDLENLMIINSDSKQQDLSKRITMIANAVDKMLRKYTFIAPHGCRIVASRKNLSIPSRTKLKQLGYNLRFTECDARQAADFRLRSSAFSLQQLDIHRHVSVVILVSGDSDFINTVKMMKRKGYGVVGIAWRSSCSHKLIAQLDEFIPLDDLLDLNKYRQLSS